jgi:hypothetical protein
MSFLYPLFLAGIAAIGLPILLHMIRRQTRKRIRFSSLMFLRTSIPRFKNRTRLENLLLLFLRCIILVLLAFVFSRPFFPREASSGPVSLRNRMVILIDTSASMRRAGIWEQVISEAKSVLKDVSRNDRVCVMTFDQDIETLMGFEQWQELDPGRRVAVITEQISRLSPTWAATDLGTGLVGAAEAIEDDRVDDGRSTKTLSQVVLISDLQKGSSLEGLTGYEWPAETSLSVKTVRCPGKTNAALQLVTNRAAAGGLAEDGAAVLRVINSSDAAVEGFQVRYPDGAYKTKTEQTKDVYVPAGHSSVVRIPIEADRSGTRRFILAGDDHDFDNTLFVAPLLQQQVNILYVGSDNPSDSKQMLFYLKRAFAATRTLQPRVIVYPGDKTIPIAEIKTAHLVIAADRINNENLAGLRKYVQSGGTLLLVMKSIDDVETLKGLSGIEAVDSEESEVDQYAMLGRIDFEHPVFLPFRDPRFGDFTRIHFWKYRRLNKEYFPDAQVLAAFDSGDPALLGLPIEKGSLLVLTSGWQPSDSQLALCSKFVPLLYSILEYGGVTAGQQLQYFVGDQIPIPRSIGAVSSEIRIRRPDNSLISLDAGRDVFEHTDMPGVYVIETSAGRHQFAVNLPAAECRTAPLQIEDIERFGVSFKPSSGIAAARPAQAKRQISFAGMENEQKLWRWVLVVLLIVSLAEIWLAGWLTRPPSNLKGEAND